VKRRFDNKTPAYIHGIYTDVSIYSSNYSESCQNFCTSNVRNWIEDIVGNPDFYLLQNFCV